MPEKTVFIDTETSDNEDGSLRLLMGYWEIWRTNTDTGLPVCLLDTAFFYEESEFYEMLSSVGNARIVAHNWNFDASVLRLGSRDNMDKYQYDIDLTRSIVPASNSGLSPFLLTLVFANHEIEMLCNTNYYRASLESLGPSVGQVKTAMPSEMEPEAMMEYCKNDTEILRKAYFQIHKFTDDVAGTTPGITLAMSANRVYRHKYFHSVFRVQGSQHLQQIHRAEVSSYKGGRTDTFWKGSPTGGMVYKYDVNSLYPSQMLGKIPVRYAQRLTVPHSIKYLHGYYDDGIVLYDITIDMPENHQYSHIGTEGVRTENGLIFPAGTFRQWVWQPMVEAIDDIGCLGTIHRAYLYEHDAIFREFIEDFYELRMRFREEGNAAYDLLTKLMMNSLYGKFGQKQFNDWEIADDRETQVISDGVDMNRFREYYDDILTEYYQISGHLYRQEIPHIGELSKQSVMSIAAYITTCARRVLWDGLREIIDLEGRLYTCDTDSIVSDTMLPPHIVSDTYLGKWKLEAEYPAEKAYFVAPKHYQLGDDIKIKGVRNPRKILGTFEQHLFPNFTTSLSSKMPDRRRRLEGDRILTVLKTPSGENRKRIETGEGRPTLPIIMTH